ncbi:hypothetical protein ACVWWO_001913 [Bradyrhizobium sp. F1.13.1]
MQRPVHQATIAEKSPPPTMSLSALTFSPLTKPTTQDSKAVFTTKFFLLFSQAVQDCEAAPTIVDPAFREVGKSSIITMASARFISSSTENGYFQGGFICCFARRRKHSFGFFDTPAYGDGRLYRPIAYLRLQSGQ